MKTCGIYKITCNSNGKYYIGSSIVINKRWARHKRELRNNTHTNKYLQNAWNKYGEDSFMFEIVCESSEDTLLILEQEYLDNSKCYDKSIGFNICKTVSIPPKQPRHFIVKDPNGIIHKGINVSEFARKHNLHLVSLIGLINGNSKSISYKGWTLPETKLTTYKIKSPTGKIHHIEWQGCANFARKYNLHDGELSKVLHGKTKSVKGWTLP